MVFGRLRGWLGGGDRRPSVWAIEFLVDERTARVLVSMSDPDEPHVLRATRTVEIPAGAFLERVETTSFDLDGVAVPVERYRLVPEGEVGGLDATRNDVVTVPLALQGTTVPATRLSDEARETLEEAGR